MPKQNFIPGTGLSLLLVMATAVSSQAQLERTVSLTTSPITVITGGDLQRTVQVNNIKEILTFNPNFVLKERRSEINLPGLSGATTTIILINGNRMPASYRSGNSIEPIDLNTIPTSLISNVEVVKDGAASVYGNDAIAGVVNIILRKDADLTGIRNEYKEDWAASVAEIFLKPNTNLTINDKTFGDGKVEINLFPQNNFMIETRKYLDPFGIQRLQINRQYNRDGAMYEVKDFYDCSGMRLHSEANITEPFGYTFDVKNISYLNGQPSFTYRDIAPGKAFQPYRQFDLNDTLMPIDNSWQTYAFRMPKKCNNDYPKNLFFAGLSYLMEDSYDPFGLIGGNLNYTRMICPKLGLGADLNFNTGSQNNVDYTKLNFMVGPEYFPFSSMGVSDQFSISPFVYAGISRLTNKYSNSKNSSTDLSGLAGINFGYEVTPKIRIKAGAAINPVFFENNTAVNKQLTLGLRFAFGQPPPPPENN